MKLARVSLVGAVVAAGAMVLAGCATSGGGSEIQEGTALTVVENSGFTTANSNTADGNTTYNSNITYMTGSTFNYYDATPELVKNTKFGTYKVVSEDPLTVKYTITDGVKWSDGTPVDAADLLLGWASSISQVQQGRRRQLHARPAAGGGLDLVTEVPKISDNDKSLTLVYSKPYVDWEIGVRAEHARAHHVRAARSRMSRRHRRQEGPDQGDPGRRHRLAHQDRDRMEHRMGLRRHPERQAAPGLGRRRTRSSRPSRTSTSPSRRTPTTPGARCRRSRRSPSASSRTRPLRFRLCRTVRSASSPARRPRTPLPL